MASDTCGSCHQPAHDWDCVPVSLHDVLAEIRSLRQLVEWHLGRGGN